MRQTGDLNLVKKINKALVLDQIRRKSPISRAQIASETGLTKATVSSLVNEWIERDLVREIGTGASSGGRKPVMLLFHADAGHAVGVDLGVNYIRTALCDLNGQVLAEERRAHGNASLEAVLETLRDCIAGIIRQASPSTYGTVGIGIGIPGICDAHGCVLFAPNLGWTEVPLKEWIEREFGVPAVIDNDANAGAAGVQKYGGGSAAGNMVYLSLGIGIGAGLILGGELYRGATGFSGEVGHLTIDRDGRRCRCGSYGCWELYASENALLASARSQLGIDSPELESLIALADSGHAEATALFSELGRQLGIGIVNLVNAFNPERLVVGGRLAAAEKWLLEPMRQTAVERLLPYLQQRLRLEFSPLGERTAVRGACSLAIDRFISSAIEKDTFFHDRA